MPQFVKATSLQSLNPGKAVAVEIQGNDIALFNVDGTIHAIDNVCPHQGAPLAQGYLKGDQVACPWHMWRFNVKTGECATIPAAKLKRYEVRIEGEDVLVDIG